MIAALNRVEEYPNEKKYNQLFHLLNLQSSHSSIFQT